VTVMAVVAISCVSIFLSAAQDPKKLLTVENVFDALSLTASGLDNLRPSELSQTLTRLGLSAVTTTGDVRTWLLIDDVGQVMAITTPLEGKLGFDVVLSHHAPSKIAPVMLEALTRAAAKTRPGTGSTLQLVMPNEPTRNPRCVKETFYVVSMQGDLISKHFSLICPK
jgi:hypothetical protein